MANQETAEIVKSVELNQEDIELLKFIRSSLERTKGSAWIVGGTLSDAYVLGRELTEDDARRPAIEAGIEKIEEGILLVNRILGAE